MKRCKPHLANSHTRDILRMAAAAIAIANATTFAAVLNDTGQSACYNAAGATESCANAGQDGRYGRDAAATAGALYKSGAGAVGFDFTKIAIDGSALPANAVLGPNAGDWACTRDNVTGRVWEIKSDSFLDLRYEYNGYTWYSTAANNGGDPGSLGWDSCNGTLAAYSNECNTRNYTSAVNAATLCGHSDWRLPTINELQSIKSFGGDDPGVDANYFPNTVSGVYWATQTYAAATSDAWSEDFTGGVMGSVSSTSSAKGAAIFVRLVRGGGAP